MANDSVEFSVSDIIRTLRRQWKIVVGVPVVVTAASIAFTFTLKDTFEAEGTLEIGRVMEYPIEGAPTVVDRIGSKSFLAKVGSDLGLTESPGALANMTKVESIFAESRDRKLTRGVKVTVKSDDPAKSAKLAQAVMEAAVADHGEIYKESWDLNYAYLQQLEDDIAKVKAQIDRGYEDISRLVGSGRLNQVEMSYLASYVEEKESYILHLKEESLSLRQKLLMRIYTHPTRISVEPIPSSRPSGPPRRRIILVAFTISLALGIVIAFFFDRPPSRVGSAAREPAANEKKKEPPVEPEPEAEPEPELAPPPSRPDPPPPRVPPRGGNRLPENNHLTIIDFWRLLRSQAWILGVTLILGLALGIVYGLAKPREYKSDFVISLGIVGDHWVHSPLLIEEYCKSHWFLSELSGRLNRKYDVFELEEMIEAELIMTPSKGLTRELRISVAADSPEDCYALATGLAGLLEEADREVFEETHKIYESYLGDLEKVMDGLTTRPGGLEPSALIPGLAVYPPDEETAYRGGGQVYSLFSRSIPYEDNPYAVSSLALFQQVYIDTYVKTRSSIFSQPTKVVVPPLKPTQPEGPGTISIVLIVTFVSLVLGITLAAVNYRFQRARAGA